MDDASATTPPRGDRSSRPIWLGKDKRRWDHVRIHLQVLHDPRLDTYAMTVYMGLAAHAELQSGAARPSMETLAAYGQMSPRKVAGCIAALVEAGYIEVLARPGKASMYHLLPPPPMHEVQGSEPGDPGTPCRAPQHEVPDTPAHGATEQEPGTENPGQEEPPGGDLVALFDDRGFLTPERRARKEAHELTEKVFAQRRPRPAQSFVAVLGVAKRLLGAGNDPEAVLAAMVEPGAMTTPAVEFRIGRARERGQPRFTPDAGIITDRTASDELVL